MDYVYTPSLNEGIIIHYLFMRKASKTKAPKREIDIENDFLNTQQHFALLSSSDGKDGIDGRNNNILRR